VANEKHKFDLITPADDLDYDPLSLNKTIVVEPTKVKGRKKPPVDYQTISKDFIKVDRNILDAVIPFLMEKYNSGTTILYIALYRLSYGFRKNKLNISDEDLAKRTGIPKRTLAKYRIELEEADLIRYERGYKSTRKPEYTILLPSQSQTFSTIYTKTANKLHKDVKCLDGRTIYTNIDKHTTIIEELVRDFYSKLGKTKNTLTRKVLDDGIRTIQRLLTEDYTIEDIKGCVDYTLDIKKDVYSISYLNYSIGDYLSTQATNKDEKKKQTEEDNKTKIRNKEIALEKHLETLFDELPEAKRNRIMYDVERLAHDYMKENNLKYGEMFIISDYLNTNLRELFSDVVRNW